MFEGQAPRASKTLGSASRGRASGARRRSRRCLARRSIGRFARVAELVVAVVGDEGLLLGAFQRASTVPLVGPGATMSRRGSGGPEVHVGPGTVYVGLALANPGALVPCDERRIVNRYVRPLLRALTRTGSLAHAFGRDWVSVAHRPAAWVGFGHDATTRRTLFEAFVAVRTPFARTERGSFRGHAPATLEAIAGKAIDPEAIALAVVDAYRPTSCRGRTTPLGPTRDRTSLG